MNYRIAVIGGDGIGPEVVEAATFVLESLPIRFDFAFYEAGDQVLRREGVALPEETREGAMGADAVLFGAAGETAADVIIRLRAELDTFVNLRPIRAYRGVKSLRPETDMVIVRENTECLYKGIEREVTRDVTIAIRVITAKASKRIARYAFEFAVENGRKKVTAVHKSNVMKFTDGLFLSSVEEVAKGYDIPWEARLVDAAAMGMILNPEDFDVIVTTNMFGDILSDLGAGLIGGLGLCPSANIGEEHGLFEPVHGTAPDVAGKGTANPSAAILSAAMMLRYLGEGEAAARLEAALERAIEAGKTTPDLGGELSTMEMAEEVTVGW